MKLLNFAVSFVCFGLFFFVVSSVNAGCWCWYVSAPAIPDYCVTTSGFAGIEVAGTRITTTSNKILAQSVNANGQCPSPSSTPPTLTCEVTGTNHSKYEVDAGFSLSNFSVSGSLSDEITSTCSVSTVINDYCQCCHVVLKLYYQTITADFLCQCSILGSGLGLCEGTSTVSGSYTEYLYMSCEQSTPACTPPCTKNCPSE
jgi:hypothetical protein